MLMHKGYLFAVGDAGSAMCFKSDTGEQGWRKRLGGGFSASPIRVGENIYAVNEKAQCFVFKADPTKFELVATNKLGDEALATPAIAGGQIFMRVAHKTEEGRKEMLYCIGQK